MARGRQTIDASDAAERRINVGCSVALAVFSAVLFLPLSMWVLP